MTADSIPQTAQISQALQLYFQHAHTCLALLDRDFNFICVNAAYARADNRSIEEFTGKNHFALYPSDAQPAFEAVLHSKQPFQAYARPFEYANHPERGTRYWDVMLSPILDAQGEVQTLLLSRNNVTERVLAQQALQERESNLRVFFDTIDDFLFVLDGQGCIQRVNQTVLTRLGYSEAELLGQHILRVHPREYHQEAQQIIGEMLAKQRDICPLPLQTAHGTQIPVETRVVAGSWNGQPALFGVSRDISARLSSEAERDNALTLLKTVIDAAPVRIFWKDRQSRYLGCNPLFARDAGKNSPEELLGQDDFAMGWADQAALYRADDQRVMTSGTTQLNYDEPQTTPDGRTLWLRTSKVPLHNTQGEVIGVLGIYDDMTQQKQIETSLQQAKAHSERLLAEAAEREFFLQQSQKVGQIGGWRADPVNNTVVWTEGVYDIVEMPLDYKPDLATALDYYLPESRIRVMESLQKSLANNQPFSIQVEVRGARSGDIKNVELRGEPHHNALGQVDYMMGTIQDVSEHKRILRNLAQRAEERAILLSVGRELAATLELDTLLQQVLTSSLKLTGMDTAAIYLGTGDMLTLSAAIPPIPPDFPSTLRHAPLDKHHLIRQAVQSGQPLFIADLRNETLAEEEWQAVRARDLRTTLYLPMRVRDELSGVLMISSIGKTVALPEDSREIYTTYANMAALAIANAQLYGASRRHAHEREQQYAFTHAVLNNAPMGIHLYQCEADGRLVFMGANPAADQILQTNNRQFIGQSIEVAFPPLAQTEVPERYRQIARNGGTWINDQIDYDDGNIRGAYQIKAFQTLPGKMAVFFEDVTVLKRHEHALRRSEERLRFALKSARQSWFDAYPQSGQVEVGPDYPAMLGYAASAFQSSIRDWLTNIHPEDVANVQRLFDDILHSGGPLSGEYRRQTHDGHWIWLRSFGAVTERDVNGQPLRITGIHMDISEQKQLQLALSRHKEELEQRVAERTQALKASHQQLQQTEFAMERVGIGIAWSNCTTGQFEHINDEVCRQLGYTQEELLQRTVADINPHFKLKDYAAAVQAIRTAGGNMRFESEHQRKDGSRFPVEVSTYLYSASDREWVIAFHQDVSARREAEARNQQLLDILAESPDFIGTCNLAGKVRYLNPAAFRMVGLAEDTTLDILSIQGFHPEWAYRKIVEEGIPTTLQTGNWEGETALLHTDGHSIPTWQSLLLHRDAEGKPKRMSTIIRDIHQQKATEQALIEAKQAAEAANLAKSAFLANMSHEIRTPMNAILGMAYLLRQSEDLNSAQLKRLEKLEFAGKHLLSLLNDVLDLSKIEAGKIRLDIQPFSPESLLDNTNSMLANQATLKGLQFRVEHGPLPEHLCGDQMRIMQCLINLLGNAIKFTDRGAVTLHVQQVPLNASSITLRFDVEDSGIGISPLQLPRLFQPFEQADASTTRHYGGTGLGLVLTKHLVELMGGTLGVQSEPGQGSHFWFELPFQPCMQNTLPPPAPPAAPPVLNDGQTLLVVEDEVINQEILRDMLQKIGFVVEVVSNGAEALARVARQPYALILMDMQMPVLDGLSASQQIRAMGITTPIVACTANAFSDDRAACLAAGMVDIITKPLQIDSLSATLAKYIQTPPGHVPQQHDAPGVIIPPATALADPTLALSILHELQPLLARGDFMATPLLEERLPLLYASLDRQLVAQLSKQIERFDSEAALLTVAELLRISRAEPSPQE